METQVNLESLERRATKAFQETLECRAKMESLDYLDNLVRKETLVFLESLAVWDNLDRRATVGRWEYQVLLVQRVLKETLVHRDILDSEAQTEKKETGEYLVSQVSGSQDIQEKRVRPVR